MRYLVCFKGKLVEVGSPELLVQGDNLLSVSIRDLKFSNVG